LPSSLSGDIVQIKNILRHLLHNAVKFTHDGEIKVSVNAVNVSGEAIFVQFGVTDSGIGIAPAQQKMIFQPFVQADGSTTRKYGGAGIGLVLSKRLVEKLGGVIVLESEEGKGSTFWFTIPLYRVQNGSLKVKH
jgi:hypothetical protein